jgi:uracil phosphoribosyltransferase
VPHYIRLDLEDITKVRPDIDIFTAAIDEVLNEHKYMVAGLNDAGYRIFGTK